MNLWEGLFGAVIAAVIALLTSIAFQIWNRRRVSWVMTGEAHKEYVDGRLSGNIRANIELFNTGDDTAYRVFVVRCSGLNLEPWTEFISACVASGEKIDVVMRVSPENWESSWIEIQWVSSPTWRNRTRKSRRQMLAQVFSRIGDGPLVRGESQPRVDIARLDEE